MKTVKVVIVVEGGVVQDVIADQPGVVFKVKDFDALRTDDDAAERYESSRFESCEVLNADKFKVAAETADYHEDYDHEPDDEGAQPRTPGEHFAKIASDEDEPDPVDSGDEPDDEPDDEEHEPADPHDGINA